MTHRGEACEQNETSCQLSNGRKTFQEGDGFAGFVLGLREIIEQRSFLSSVQIQSPW